jgi:hypothetical protein
VNEPQAIYILMHRNEDSCAWCHVIVCGATTDKAVADAWEARGDRCEAVEYKDGEIDEG